MSDDVEPFPPAVRPGAPDEPDGAPARGAPTTGPAWSAPGTPAGEHPAAPAWPAPPASGYAQSAAWPPVDHPWAQPHQPPAQAPAAAGDWQSPATGTGWSPDAGAGSSPAGTGWSPAGGGWSPSSSGGGWAPGETGGGWTPSSGGGGWPPAPGATGGSGGSGGWSAPGGGWGDPWGRGPGQFPSGPPRNGRRGLAAALVAVVVAAFIGVGVGRAINSTRTITVTPFSPSQPFVPGANNGGSATNPGGAGGAGGTGATSAAIANVEKGVVDINTKLGYQSATAAGTGLVITSNGEVLTNNHVIQDATTISATVVTTGKTYSVKVLGEDPSADVALIQLQGASGLPTVPLGNSSSVHTGDAVTALGNAGGVGGMPSVVTGQVLATGQSITASDVGGANAEHLTDLIEMNAPIQEGDSGGPVVDSAGKVIGMNTAASTSGRFQVAANTAFAIPINDALTVVHQIENGQESSTVHLGLPGFLGVEVNPQGTASGALISGVVSGSAASKAGIQSGDVITGVNGHQVSQASDLTTLLQTHHPGDKVSITWQDQSGASHTATVTLGTGPAN